MLKFKGKVNQFLLKRWDSKTFEFDKTEWMSGFNREIFIDITNMISINDRLFFNRSQLHYQSGVPKSSCFCSHDPFLPKFTLDYLVPLAPGDRPYAGPLYPLGKTGLIAFEDRNQIAVFDTNARKTCLNVPLAQNNHVCVSPSSEHFCLYNSANDYLMLTTLYYPNPDIQPEFYQTLYHVPCDGNTLQDLYWSEDGYLVALIKDASQKNYRLQIINILPDSRKDPEYPNRIFLEMGQVIDTFTSQPKVAFFAEGVCVFLTLENSEKLQSFQTYSLTDKQKLQNLSLAVLESTPLHSKGVCDIIAGYAYGRMFPSVSEAKSAPSQLQLRRQP